MQQNNNHNDDNLPPKLAAIRKREWHKAPEGYFAQLPVAVLQKIKAAQVLYSIDKKELHEAPQDYFNGLAQKAIQAKAPAKIIPMRTRVLRWTAAAASLALVVTVSFAIFNTQQPPTVAQHTQPVESNAVYSDDYLVDELHEADLIAALVAEKNLETGTGQQSAEIDYLAEAGDLDLENL